MTSEWLEYLSSVFDSIKKDFFQKDWFIKEDPQYDRIIFGTEKGNQYYLRTTQANILYIHSLQFNHSDHIVDACVDKISCFLREEGVEALISGGGRCVSTGEESEKINKILQCLADGTKEMESSHFPLYSFVPSMAVPCVYLFHQNKTLLRTFEDLQEAIDFVECERKEKIMVNSFLNEFDEWLKSLEGMSVYGNKLNQLYYFEEGFSLTFTLRKVVSEEEEEVHFEASYTIDERDVLRSKSIQKLIVIFEAKMKEEIEKKMKSLKP